MRWWAGWRWKPVLSRRPVTPMRLDRLQTCASNDAPAWPPGLASFITHCAVGPPPGLYPQEAGAAIQACATVLYAVGSPPGLRCAIRTAALPSRPVLTQWPVAYTRLTASRTVPLRMHQHGRQALPLLLSSTPLDILQACAIRRTARRDAEDACSAGARRAASNAGSAKLCIPHALLPRKKLRNYRRRRSTLSMIVMLLLLLFTCSGQRRGRRRGIQLGGVGILTRTNTRGANKWKASGLTGGKPHG